MLVATRVRERIEATGRLTRVVTPAEDGMQSWPIHEAKARLSELVKRAQKQPQQVAPLEVV